MAGQRPSMTVNYSVLQQSHLMQWKHTTGYHQHRGGEWWCAQRSCYSVEWYRGYKAVDLKPKNWRLRDSKREVSFGGQTVTELNPLASSSQIWFKPAKCLPSNLKPIIKSSQENSMFNGIEGSGKVMRSQYRDFASIHCCQNIVRDFKKGSFSCVKLPNM